MKVINHLGDVCVIWWPGSNACFLPDMSLSHRFVCKTHLILIVALSSADKIQTLFFPPLILMCVHILHQTQLI
jgi:hypothetical protein